MHLHSTLLTCLPAFSTHESGLVNVEVLKKFASGASKKIFNGLTNPKILPPALLNYICSQSKLSGSLAWANHSTCNFCCLFVHNGPPRCLCVPESASASSWAYT